MPVGQSIEVGQIHDHTKRQKPGKSQNMILNYTQKTRDESTNKRNHINNNQKSTCGSVARRPKAIKQHSKH